MVSLGSPSSPPTPPRGLVAEFFSSLLGIGELAFGRPYALQRFNLSVDGFWRTFLYAGVLLPAVLSLIQTVSLGGELFSTVMVNVLSTVAAMTVSLMATIKMHGILRQMRSSAESGGLLGGIASLEELAPLTLPFLVPFLWAFMLESLLVLLLVLGGNGTAAVFLKAVLFVTALVAQWRAARTGLSLGGGQSVVMVGVYFGAQLVCNYVLLILLSLLHG